MIVLPLKNTIQYVQFTRCDRKMCRCIEHILQQNKRANKHRMTPMTLPITQNEYHAYKVCHETHKNKSKREIFQL